MEAMKMAKIFEKEPQFIIKKGNPVSVIIDIRDFQELLERIEAAEDLHELKRLRDGKLDFRPLDEFLEELKDVRIKD